MRLGDATWNEVHTLAEDPTNEDGLRTPIVLVPIGSTEQHGPHLPIATDTLIAEAAARATEPVLVLGQYSMARAAELVEKKASRPPITGPAHAVRMLRELVETRGT